MHAKLNGRDHEICEACKPEEKMHTMIARSTENRGALSIIGKGHEEMRS